jgi:hypothetical protein
MRVVSQGSIATEEVLIIGAGRTAGLPYDVSGTAGVLKGIKLRRVTFSTASYCATNTGPLGV